MSSVSAIGIPELHMYTRGQKVVRNFSDEFMNSTVLFDESIFLLENELDKTEES